MMEHNENENFLLTCIFIATNQSTVRQKMSIFISPSNNCLLATAKISISTQFGQKRTKIKI